MPIEKKYALPELMEALRQFRRRVTLEYVLIGGKNDSVETADQLAKLAQPARGAREPAPAASRRRRPISRPVRVPRCSPSSGG